MSLFKSKMHQIRSLVSVRLSVQMEFDTKYVDGFFHLENTEYTH